MSFISVKNLKYRYPHVEQLALKNLSFTIEKGEFIGIIGENGSGKSTLAQALLGLVPQFYKGAYGGEVLIDGMDAAKTPLGSLCKKAGLIFQNPFNQLSGAKDTVLDEVAYGLQNLGLPREEILTRVEESLKSMDIWEYRDRNPFDLSGGQLQRVAIASILVMRPELLILDEPTSQLDPAGSEEVFRTVEKLKRSGITIVMIEQKMEKIAEYCDKTLLLHKGELVAFGATREIFALSNIADYGIQPPFALRFAKAQGIQNADGSYPLSPEELLSLVEEKRKAELLKELREELSGFEGGTSKKLCIDTDKAERLRKERGHSVDSVPNTGLGTELDSGIDTAFTAVFQIEHLDFSYTPGKKILENLNLSLDSRPTAIIGQNGAGKTTLVRLMKGLLHPDKGRLSFHGENISRKTVAELAAKVGYVFQNPDDQIFKSRVLEEVMFGPMNIGMSREEAEGKAREALELVQLSHATEKNPYDLELSDRKLIAIASVLSMNPELIILDEPTIAQDAKGKEILRRIIETESARGKLVIAILHDMEFVLHSFQRVIVMTKGEILLDDAPLRVFREKEALKKAALLPPPEIELLELLSENSMP